MRRDFIVFLLILVMCEFVIGASSSVIETNFIINDQKGVDDVAMNQKGVDDDLGFWGMYGDYLVVGVIVLVIAVVYLNTIKGTRKKRRK